MRVRPSEYRFARANWFELGRVEQIGRVARADKSLEGACSNELGFAQANWLLAVVGSSEQEVGSS